MWQACFLGTRDRKAKQALKPDLGSSYTSQNSFLCPNTKCSLKSTCKTYRKTNFKSKFILILQKPGRENRNEW